jgi:hypothetical protein
MRIIPSALGGIYARLFAAHAGGEVDTETTGAPMSHNVQGLIAKSACFEAFSQLAPADRVAELEQGFGLLLLKDEAGDPETDPIPHEIAQIAQALSVQAPVAFVETAYFGGAGVQRSALWENGILVSTCITQPGDTPREDRPINTVLRALGVDAGDDGCDEFAMIGLMAYRSNRECLATIAHETVSDE